MKKVKVFVSESAGFCFGVSRSVKLAERMLEEKFSKPCYSLGELIHNSHVVEEFEKRGLLVLKSADELPAGARVIIRSHGVAKSEYDKLSEKGAQITDATCPMVKHIHDIVFETSAKGRTPVIIGDANHPEVIAIRGWCEGAMVFSDSSSFKEWLDTLPCNLHKPLTLVFQTTQTQENLQEIKKAIKKVCTNCQVFDTICEATSIRQHDAAVLSQSCDAMVVIGARHSANSVHLAEICSEFCDNVQFISCADELDLNALVGVDTVGITAGASTPAWIIKEVRNKMTVDITNEELTAGQEVKEPESTATEAEAAPVITPEADAAQAAPPETEESFDKMLEDSIKTIYNGDTVTGIVAAITPTEISVDLGTKHSGYIPVSEFTDNTDVPINELIKVGDTVEAYAVRVNDVEGTVMLSKKRLDAVSTWSVIEAAVEDGTIFEGVVAEENKGGVVVNVKGVRVFIPASQTDLSKGADMSELVKQKVRLKITEVNRGRRRVVGSIRAVTRDERRERSEKIWNDIEVGKRYSGTVKSLTNYGAFVDIGGIDGMIHVSQLSWSRIKLPSEVLSVGSEIEVYVINFDKEARKISLGYKDPGGNPWTKFKDAFNVDDVISATIVKLMPFGAFAEIMPGVDGLIHISQISTQRIGRPDEVLNVGDTVEAKITAIENEKQKISLSIRALTEPKPVTKEDKQGLEEGSVAESDALVYEVSETGQTTGLLPEAEPDEAPETAKVNEVEQDKSTAEATE